MPANPTVQKINAALRSRKAAKVQRLPRVREGNRQDMIDRMRQRGTQLSNRVADRLEASKRAKR